MATYNMPEKDKDALQQIINRNGPAAVLKQVAFFIKDSLRKFRVSGTEQKRAEQSYLKDFTKELG